MRKWIWGIVLLGLTPWTGIMGLQGQVSAVLAQDATNYRVEGFSAQASLQTVLVSWTFFTSSRGCQWGTLRVERSQNGISWQRVACLPFHLTPRGGRPFRLADPVVPGIAYYRLVLERDSAELELAQSPFRNPGGDRPLQANADYDRRKVTVLYTVQPNRSLLLRLYNQIGEQLTTALLPSSGNASRHSYELDFSKFPNGIYLVVITQVEDGMDVADHRIEWFLPG